ncbi:unnamed protein product [Rotaria socialis]|uniref:SAM domain-containing protein n=1 Tax=Rotaria socialis TaxID=392032 RepID=A0A818A3I0_9BILA|nr:unnamed protein product [Rotaria socialis]
MYDFFHRSTNNINTNNANIDIKNSCLRTEQFFTLIVICLVSFDYYYHQSDQNNIIAYNIPDPECTGIFNICTDVGKERLGRQSMRAIHEQMDGDKDGFFQSSESTDVNVKITFNDLWMQWQNNPVYNWTTDNVVNWLVNFSHLPQYVENLHRNQFDGRMIPRFLRQRQTQKNMNLILQEVETLQTAEGNLLALKIALNQAEEHAQQESYEPSSELIDLLKRTYRTEEIAFEVKRKLTENSLMTVKEQINKISKMQKGVFHALRIAHTNCIVNVKERLTEIHDEYVEREER